MGKRGNPACQVHPGERHFRLHTLTGRLANHEAYISPARMGRWRARFLEYQPGGGSEGEVEAGLGGVAEGVLVDDPVPANTLRTGESDIFGIEHF